VCGGGPIVVVGRLDQPADVEFSQSGAGSGHGLGRILKSCRMVSDQA
jgi:hypothetical protein